MALPALDKRSNIRVDFIFSCILYEKQAIKNPRKVFLNNTKILFASLEDLIIHKIFAQRQRDIDDIKIILLKNKVNIKYIKKWLLQFDKTFN